MLVQPDNVKHVHHILFYGCTGNDTEALLNVTGDCFAEAMPITANCNAYIGGWAVGGQVRALFILGIHSAIHLPAEHGKAVLRRALRHHRRPMALR